MNILTWLRDHRRRLEALEGEFHPTFLTTPLTSTSWDGDAYSSVASTVLDLSAVFGVPAGVKAVLLQVEVRDSGSAGATAYFFAAGPATNPKDTALVVFADHGVNDGLQIATAPVPCDANGDIYYRIAASGVGTMDVWIWVWGYWL